MILISVTHNETLIPSFQPVVCVHLTIYTEFADKEDKYSTLTKLSTRIHNTANLRHVSCEIWETYDSSTYQNQRSFNLDI